MIADQVDIRAIRGHFTFPERGRIVTNNAASTQPPRELVALYEQWANTGYRHAVQQQARLGGGKTGHDDSAHQLLQRFAAPAGRGGAPQGWARGVHSGLEHALAPRYVGPDVPTKFIVCQDHQFFRPPSCGSSHSNAWAPSPTRFLAVTVPRSATPGTQRSSRQLPRLTGSGRFGSRRSGHLPQQPQHFRVEPLGDLRRGRIVVRRQLTGDGVVSDPGTATRHLLDEDGDRRVRAGVGHMAGHLGPW
jgi:hypothetical protein